MSHVAFRGAQPVTVATDQSFMRRCIELAEAALERGETAVGSLLIRDGRIIAEAGESTRTKHDPSAHAEVEAVRIACEHQKSLDLAGCTLYTTVEPCVLCGYVIRRTGVDRIVYGVAAGQAGSITSRYSILSDTTLAGWPPPPQITSGILSDECEIGSVATRHAARIGFRSR